ncbi:1825_t:CDS:1 [Racocetra fulgida]|uniref:1825_t:CDS:1 n=1 Tax=Racocetra fulgida TaxID=60492 RepID=A0A9N8Z1C4_9GLOM|nr:1825_t:CDS:1 [Racocetra fulgida]
MVNANEWLNNKIPADEREQATTLYIYGKCQCMFGIMTPVTTSLLQRLYSRTVMTPSNALGFGSNPMTSPYAFAPNPLGGVNRNQVGNAMFNNNNNCQHCNNRDQDNFYTAPDYCFYNVILEGELDLNDFVNLRLLYIEGVEYNKEQQQKLTKLKIDRCSELTYITINYTTLGYLSLGCKPKLQCTNFIGNKRLIFCDSVIKNQVERLTHLIQDPNVINLDDLKLKFKKIEEENLDSQLDITKSSLDENDQLWLESLIEAHKEVLQNNSAYARKQLEKCKKKLAEVLTDEEIQYILGKEVEINELGTQLNNIDNHL